MNFVKRGMDVALSLVGLLVLSPLLVMIATLVRWRIGTPVFFCQQRAGLHGKPFWLIKFRTMTDARDAKGMVLPDAERLIPFGQFLRKSSLDELPTLFNVLRGDMSLVGPRPLLMDYLPVYSPQQRRRHEVVPGITGWAQVNGRNTISWEDKFTLDVWYVDHASFWLDFRILLQTVLKVIRREGTSPESMPTMPRFTGSRTNDAA